MINLLQAAPALGLELLNDQEFKGAEIILRQGKVKILKLFAARQLNTTLPFVKQLYIHQPCVTTGVAGNEVLVRPMQLPLTKDKDIAAALAFQAEPLLPFPPEEGLLTHQVLNQTADTTSLTLLAIQKSILQQHLTGWSKLSIEPEKVSSYPMALCQFAQQFIPSEKPILVLYINDKWTTGVLVKDGKLIASFSQQEGLKTLMQEYDQVRPFNFSDSLENHPKLNEALKRLQQVITKVCFALTKESKGEPLGGILFTGEAVKCVNLDRYLAESLNLPLLECKENTENGYSSQEAQSYAIPIGLALDALQSPVDFRQQEFSDPHPWRRLQMPFISFLTLMVLLTCVFYLFSQTYLSYEEDKIKQEYADLLTAMNKPYDQFEQAFLAKHPMAREKHHGEIVPPAQMHKEDLLERLDFLHKDLQGTPDSFPLFANTPRVSDTLAWLANHPNVASTNANGTIEPRLQLENFSYVMVKRPAHGKKQEKYQVKVELEFSSPTPKWAREFHDALIAPNDFVDPKAEVKWSSNRGHYKTSFFLKDKTSYPGQ